MKTVKRLLAVLLFLTLAILYIGTNYKYSFGERSGVIRKFSSKGYLCKTWEGELLLGAGMNSTMLPEVWSFAVSSDEVVNKIKSKLASGEHATVVYEQLKFRPPCSTDSEYIIVDVR